MKEKYDPSKLFSVNVVSRAAQYAKGDPTIMLNTKSGNLSFNKKSVECLSVESVKKLKVRFLCDGFKLYVDSTVEANETNFITVAKNNVGCSRSLSNELIKHYEIPDNHRAVFDLVEVEKYRFRLDLKKTEPLKKKPVTT